MLKDLSLWGVALPHITSCDVHRPWPLDLDFVAMEKEGKSPQPLTPFMDVQVLSRGNKAPAVSQGGHSGGKRGHWGSIPGFGGDSGGSRAGMGSHVPPLVFSWPGG